MRTTLRLQICRDRPHALSVSGAELAQLFPENVGFVFRVVLLALLTMLVIGILIWRASIAWRPGVGVALEQPIPFSHKHHVGDDGIDCRYCHVSVEASAFAGIPSIAICMTCHSQLYTEQPVLAPLIAASSGVATLRWQRLYKLPDFVYFNHSIHIAKGVGCETCHGALDKMPLTASVAPLTMQWCLACHRSPARYLRPPEQIFALHWQANNPDVSGAQLLSFYRIDTQRLTDCSVCHR